ncbi:MAG: DUF3488 and transglutaminase-like domain-containing protein [Massilia sp.]
MKALARLGIGAGAGLARDKADTLLLLAGALMVLIPHAGHLPLWVSALCAATLSWRAAITLRGTRMPSGALLLPLALAAMGAVYISYKTLLGRDAGVAMLVLLVAFKMLEMHAKRDLLVVIFLCFFLVLTNFFYSQSMLTALMMVGSIIALLSAQLSFQFANRVPPLRQRLLMGARMFALAAPMALLLFVLFPRLQGPLWGMPGDARSGRTGLSNSMSPGNLSSLAQSEEPAFRVKFLDPAPGQEKLYWRGPVLGRFDGRTWSAARGTLRGAAVEAHFIGQPIRQEITLEPSGNRWLFALDLPVDPPQIDGNPSRGTAEFELSAASPIEQRVRYEVASHVSYRLQAGEELDERERWLQLPAGYNPRARQLALTLRDLPEPMARARAVLSMFNTGFSYTLEPPLLGTNSVDEFLFDTHAGFCEHFASAFVVMMRMAEVPARVVTGYQGGELNPVDGFMTVRQSDAHAWAEVWLAQRGWVRIDPTAAVAPERITRGLARALPPSAPFGIESLGGLVDFRPDPNGWLAQWRFRASALNNGWNQWVLNYTPARQRGLVESLQTALLSRATLAALLAGIALILAARAWQQRHRGDPVDALYSALCERLGRLGLARASDEGPGGYAARLAPGPLAPARKAAALRFLALYSAYKYGPPRPDPHLLATLRSLLAETQ